MAEDLDINDGWGLAKKLQDENEQLKSRLARLEEAARSAVRCCRTSNFQIAIDNLFDALEPGKETDESKILSS